MNRFRYTYLLVALVLVIFLRPFIDGLTIGVVIVNTMLLATLVAGAFAVAQKPHQYVIVCVLGLLAAITQILWDDSRSNAALSASLVSNILFLSYITWALLKKLFAPHRRVTSNTLHQSVCVYLLLGLVWSSAYALLEHSAPGSFTFANAPRSEITPFDRFIGFSFTTLTTLGYGNVAPATPRADSLSTLQATLGQIYIAIVIARIVAIQIGQEALHRRLSDGTSEHTNSKDT